MEKNKNSLYNTQEPMFTYGIINLDLQNFCF